MSNPWAAVWLKAGPTVVLLAALPLFFLCLMVLFAVRHRGQRSARVAQQGGTVFMGTFVMEYGYWVMRFPARLCLALGITPNMITGASLILGGAAGYAIYKGNFGLGGWLIIAGALCDAVDGMVARERRIASDAGEFWDASADRYNEFLTFFGLLGFYADRPWAFGLASAALLGSVMTSYTRAKGEAMGVGEASKGGAMQRHERAMYLGVSLAVAPIAQVFFEPDASRPIFHVALLGIAVVAVFSNLTAGRRLVSIYRALRERDIAR